MPSNIDVSSKDEKHEHEWTNTIVKNEYKREIGESPINMNHVIDMPKRDRGDQVVAFSQR
jgi:hypothetical protein